MQTPLTKEKLVDFVKAQVSAAVAEQVEASIKKAKEEASRIQIPKPSVPSSDQKNAALGFGRYLRLAAHTKCNPHAMLEMAKRMNDEEGKAVVGHLEKALQAGALTGGGVWIPEDLSREVIELLRNRTAVRALGARMIGMPQGTITISRLTAGSTAEYLGEGVAQRASQPSTDNLKLTYKKLRATVPLSNDLLRFEVFGADEIVRDDAVSSMRVKEDLQFIRGVGGENSPKGMLHWAAAANKFNANGTVNPQNVANDLGKAIQLLEEANIPFNRPGWIFSPRTKNFLMTQLDTNNNFLWRAELAAGRLFGYPFMVTQQIPNNLGGGMDESEVYLADFQELIIGESNDIEVRISDEAAYVDAGGTLVSALSRDETVIQLIARHDFGARHDEAIAVIQAVTWTT